MLLAYLDDVYLKTTRSRAKAAFDIVSRHIEQSFGIRVHLGKTQCWSRAGGEAPDGIPALNEAEKDPVWKGDMPPEKNGMVILGTPVGNSAFVEQHGKERLEEEKKLLSVLPDLPDLQCAWLLLYFSATPRANHLLRAVPPDLVHAYAEARDEEVWKTLKKLLGVKGAPHSCRDKAELPLRLGELGLRCSTRTFHAAYSAS